MKLDKLLEQMMVTHAQKQQMLAPNSTDNDAAAAGTDINFNGGQQANGAKEKEQGSGNENAEKALNYQSQNNKWEEVFRAFHANGIANKAKHVSNPNSNGNVDIKPNQQHQQLAILSALMRGNLTTSPNNQMPIPKAQPQSSTTRMNAQNSSQIVPLSQDIASQGLLAIGGCRQCSKTFTDRLALIHHFVDHFPNIFYSFEERPVGSVPNAPNKNRNAAVQNGPKMAATSSQQMNGNGGGGGIDFLAQLATFFALTNGNNPAVASATPTLQANAINAQSNNLFANFPKVNNGQPPTTATIDGLTGGVYKTATNNQKRLFKSATNSTASKKRQSTLAVGQQMQEVNILEKGAKRPRSGSNSNGGSLVPPLSELPYHMCPHCCLTFAETSAYRVHLAMHESEMANNAVPLSPSAGALSGIFSDEQLSRTMMMSLKCILCDMKFNSAFRLNEHMRLHTAHICQQCQKTFMTAFDLNLHMGTHTGFTYDCKDCGKCFPCRKTLAEHNRSHRMILSGGSASPEPANKTTKTSGSGSSHDGENSGSEAAANEKRRQRAARRGEKSRRNATLVAVESAAHSPSMPTGGPSMYLPIASPNSVLSTFASSMAQDDETQKEDDASSMATAHVTEGEGLTIGQLLQHMDQQKKGRDDATEGQEGVEEKEDQ